MGEDIAVAGHSRPCIGEAENGDDFLVTSGPGFVRIAVIDGLGHGPLAAEAAAAARRVLEAAPDAQPVEALARCVAPLRRTRGAAISVAWLDESQRCLTFAGVGNVEARILLPERERRLAATRGIVGAAQRTIRPTMVELTGAWLFAMHSDGVTGRFELTDLFAQSRTQAPDAFARRLVEEWGRPHDDATVAVAWPR